MGYVDTELVKLFGTASTAEAVAKMLGSGAPQQPFEIIQPDKWERAGGESYILPFKISEERQETSVLFKAIISSNADVHVERRKLLDSRGVKTPHLYGHDKGVVLEDFLPHSLEESYEKFGDSILPQLAHAHGAIAACGFQPVKNGLLRDFRADNNGQMYMIDFGADLGSARDEPTDLWPSFADEVQRRLGVSPEVVETLSTPYQAGFNGQQLTPSPPIAPSQKR